mmetsp:Transcript_59069/g.155388  ORF Transcript_59069/g.155388 Transcript_59069/m.155388 type:complete len:200 (-) Transcript_59069:201-800(-)
MADARTWLKHENAAKRCETPRHSTQPMCCSRRPPRRAPACPCPQRTPAGQPAPARHPSEPSTRPRAAQPRPPPPLLRAARAPSVPSTPGAARPSPTRCARLGHDRRRAPTARARRATSFGIVLGGVPPSARSVLEDTRTASRGRCERGARAQKQAGGAMPAMRPARGWHGAARRLTWRERQHRVGRALQHRRPGRLPMY